MYDSCHLYSTSAHYFSADVEACDAYVHNIKMAKFDSMFLARDPSLEYSALRVQFSLPITWVSGFYKL